MPRPVFVPERKRTRNSNIARPVTARLPCSNLRTLDCFTNGEMEGPSGSLLTNSGTSASSHEGKSGTSLPSRGATAYDDDDDEFDFDHLKVKKRIRTAVTIACETCRKKHRKCDGVQPVCHSCVKFSEECLWETKRKKRGPSAGPKKQPGPQQHSAASPMTPFGYTSYTNNSVSTYDDSMRVPKRGGRQAAGRSRTPSPPPYSLQTRNHTANIPHSAELQLHNISLVYGLVSIYNQDVYPSIGIVAPAMTALNKLVDGENSPMLDKKKMLMYSILAAGARSCGDLSLADLFHKQSRIILSNYFDEIDPYVALSHALNSYYLTHTEGNERARVGLATAQKVMEIIVNKLRRARAAAGGDSSDEQRKLLPQLNRSLVSDSMATAAPLWASNHSYSPFPGEVTLYDQVLPAYSFILAIQAFQSFDLDHVNETGTTFGAFSRSIAARTDSVSKYHYTLSQLIVTATEAFSDPSKTDEVLTKLEHLYQNVHPSVTSSEFLRGRVFLVYIAALQALYAYAGRVEEAVALDEPIISAVTAAPPSRIDLVPLEALFCSAQVCCRFAPERFQEHISFFQNCTAHVPIAASMLDWLLQLEERIAPIRAGPGGFASLANIPYFPIWCSDANSGPSRRSIASRFEELSELPTSSSSSSVESPSVSSPSPPNIVPTAASPVSPNLYYTFDWAAAEGVPQMNQSTAVPPPQLDQQVSQSIPVMMPYNNIDANNDHHQSAQAEPMFSHGPVGQYPLHQGGDWMQYEHPQPLQQHQRQQQPQQPLQMPILQHQLQQPLQQPPPQGYQPSVPHMYYL